MNDTFRLYDPFLALCFQSWKESKMCRAWLFEINYHSLLYAKLFTPLTGHNGSVEFQASSYFEIRFADPISFFADWKNLANDCYSSDIKRRLSAEIAARRQSSSGAICAKFLKWYFNYLTSANRNRAAQKTSLMYWQKTKR